MARVGMFLHVYMTECGIYGDLFVWSGVDLWGMVRAVCIQKGEGWEICCVWCSVCYRRGDPVTGLERVFPPQASQHLADTDLGLGTSFLNKHDVISIPFSLRRDSCCQHH